MAAFLMAHPYIAAALMAGAVAFHMFIFYRIVGDLREMLRDEAGNISTGRVVYFGTFLCASGAVLMAVWNKSLTDTIFAAYLGWPAVAYGASTFARRDMMKAQAENGQHSKGDAP